MTEAQRIKMNKDVYCVDCVYFHDDCFPNNYSNITDCPNFKSVDHMYDDYFGVLEWGASGEVNWYGD
jgi:hypothetical protein